MRKPLRRRALLMSGALALTVCSSESARSGDVISTGFHLTARPWSGTAIPPSTILAAIKSSVGYLCSIQNTDGSITVNGADSAETAAILAFGGATLLAAGDTTYLAQALKAMDWSAANYSTEDGTGTDGPEFDLGPIAKAYILFSASGKVSSSEIASWKTEVTVIKDTPYNDAHNWGAYAMDSSWLAATAGLVSTSTAQSTIEGLWSSYQKADFDTANGMYMDGSSPDSMSVEAVGRGRTLDMLVHGYDGPSAAAMTALVSQGTTTSLTLEDPSGQAPTGGRTSDHVWVDAGYEADMEAAAQETANATLAGQYQRAADLAFKSVQRWQHPDGSYSVTKNFFPDSERVGYQTASFYASYNASVLQGMAESYNAITKAVAPVAAPAEIGGYSFNTGSDWGTAIAGAGGTAVEVELRGDAAETFSNYWNSLGIVRIGATGFDTRLGPSDGRYDGTDGVSFAPTWQAGNGAWQHLAGQPGSYAGTFTSVLATPVLTIDDIVWAPTSGSGNPTFTQVLLITPDGVMSRVTQTGAPGKWGMTFPLLAYDGQTTLSRSTSGGIAEVSGYGSTESFIALDPAARLTLEGDILSSYGEMAPVRAVGTSPEQDSFVYQGQSGISASSLKSSFVVTPTGYTSSIGWVSGTLYSGQTSAGGYGASIALSGSGPASATFSTACNFILQVSNGVITAVEADRAVTATIGGKSHSLTAYSPVVL